MGNVKAYCICVKLLSALNILQGVSFNLSELRAVGSTVASADVSFLCDKAVFLCTTVVKRPCVYRSELLEFSLYPWSYIQKERIEFREEDLFPKNTLFYERSQGRSRVIM